MHSLSTLSLQCSHNWPIAQHIITVSSFEKITVSFIEKITVSFIEKITVSFIEKITVSFIEKITVSFTKCSHADLKSSKNFISKVVA